jgi:RNA polymerase sigma-70 factor, ECF subfamily
VADRSAVQGLLGEFQDKGYLTALAILGDAAAAEDAVQEANLRSLRSSSRYDAKAPFYPWFYRILKNHCLDLLRRRRPQARNADAVIGAMASPVPGADETLMAAQRHDALRRAMLTIGDSHREIIGLRHFQELSYGEIAQVLEVPAGTVMSRLYRARRALQDALESDPDWSL